MANDDTQKSAPLSSITHRPTPPREQGVDDDDMGIVFQTGKTQQRPKLNMDAPLTAPQGQAPQPKRRSLLTSTDDVFDVGGAFHGDAVEAGTIVTDKRHKRLGFGATLVGAFNEWFGETRAKIENIELPKRKEPTTIVDPENRKDVIKQAALNTKQVPRDDHALVIEKFKTLSHDAERITGRPYLVKKEELDTTKPTTGKHGSSEKLPPSPPTRPTLIPTSNVKEKQTLDLRTVSVAPKIEHRVQKDISDFVQAPQTKIPTAKPAPSITETEHPHMEPRAGAPVHGDVAPRVNEHTKVIAPPTTPPVEVRKKEPSLTTTGSGWSFFASNEKLEPTGQTPTPLAPDNLPVAESDPLSASSTVPALEPEESAREENVGRTPEAGLPVPVMRTLRSEQPFDSGVSFPHIDTVHLHAPEKFSRSATTEKKSLAFILIVVVVIVIGVVAGVGAAVYVSKHMGDTSPKTATPVMTAFFSVDSITPVPFTATRALFMQTLEETLDNANGGIVQISFSKEDASEKQLNAPETAEVLGVLAPHMGSRFLRALDTRFMIGLVTTESKAPFIILRSNSFDTAFAGMLEWEPFMQADLAPLFGTPEVEQEKNTITGSPFTDALSNNKSIRILYDRNKQERIIYAFVNNNTVVITSTTEALSAIIARMQ